MYILDPIYLQILNPELFFLLSIITSRCDFETKTYKTTLSALHKLSQSYRTKAFLKSNLKELIKLNLIQQSEKNENETDLYTFTLITNKIFYV